MMCDAAKLWLPVSKHMSAPYLTSIYDHLFYSYTYYRIIVSLRTIITHSSIVRVCHNIFSKVWVEKFLRFIYIIALANSRLLLTYRISISVLISHESNGIVLIQHISYYILKYGKAYCSRIIAIKSNVYLRLSACVSLSVFRSSLM